MTSVVVTRNYQVTLAKEIRDELDIEIGERLVAEVKDNAVVMKKIDKSPVDAIFGLWKGKIKGSSVEYVRNLRKSWRKRQQRYVR